MVELRDELTPRTPKLWVAVACAIVLAGCTAASSAGAESITGVCPDGSIFIVQRSDSIPCRGAKRVAPNEVPPLRPEYLPRPYAWEIHRKAKDPNNPYNLVDAARKTRALREKTASEERAVEPTYVPPTQEWKERGPSDLGLTDGELQDLFLIVEYSQDVAPAEFVRETADGRETLRIAMAYSEAFEARLGPDVAGHAILFTVATREAARFHANFTFVQGHLSFQPDHRNHAEMAVLQGRLGALGGEEVVLGYVVIPERMDLSQPVDVYWNDRRERITFRNP